MLGQESVLAEFRPRRPSQISYLKPDINGANDFLVHVLLSRLAAEALLCWIPVRDFRCEPGWK